VTGVQQALCARKGLVGCYPALLNLDIKVFTSPLGKVRSSTALTLTLTKSQRLRLLHALYAINVLCVGYQDVSCA
jgi:hypothetical protein